MTTEQRLANLRALLPGLTESELLAIVERETKAAQKKALDTIRELLAPVFAASTLREIADTLTAGLAAHPHLAELPATNLLGKLEYNRLSTPPVEATPKPAKATKEPEPLIPEHAFIIDLLAANPDKSFSTDEMAEQSEGKYSKGVLASHCIALRTRNMLSSIVRGKRPRYQHLSSEKPFGA